MIDVKDEIKKAEQIISIMPYVISHQLIGSAMYVDEPKDVDFLILIDNSTDACYYAEKMCRSFDTGFSIFQGEYDSRSGWCAIRKENLNFIITNNQNFYENFVKAMEVCAYLKITDKNDRIKICQIVRDGHKINLEI